MLTFEFLDLGGLFIPRMHGMTKFGAVRVASLADIVLMKAHAYQGRGEEDDFTDMKFALGLVVQKGETFEKYKFKVSEMAIINGVAGSMEMKGLLAQAVGDM